MGVSVEEKPRARAGAGVWVQLSLLQRSWPEVSDLPLSRRPGSLTRQFSFDWLDFVLEMGSHYVALDGPEIAM